jgi:GR25 family glycosyltransferase involved in LPS biosynthesis
MAFLRDSIYHVIGFNWATYRFLKPSFLFYVATFLRKVCKSGRYAAGGAWRRSSVIEVAVTDKHIRAWAAFLDIDSDYLVVFEDDAVFTIDSKQLLSDLLEQLSQGQSGRNIYVDLAGGCPLDSLKIDLLQSDQDRSFRHYQKPVTNTACGYLMSNSLVVQFHKVLTRKPWLRLIGVDWMMNALFVNLERDGADCACMHAEPTFFKHGSTTGEYVPWAR